MKRWLDAVLGTALILAWVVVASTASEATAREVTVHDAVGHEVR